MGPIRNFHEKYRKKYPQAEILEPQENTPQKIPKMAGYFGGKFWGSGISGLGAFLFGIFRGNSGSGHLGALWQVGAFSTVGHPGDPNIYVPSEPKRAHKSLTPGHPARRSLPSSEGSTAKTIYVYCLLLFFSAEKSSHP